MMDYKKQLTTIKEQYDNIGVVVIDNFLDVEKANKIYNLFDKCNNFDYINQVRERHYSTSIKNNIETLPDEAEIYTAQFNKSSTLSNNDAIGDFLDSVKLSANQYSDEKIRFYTKPLCYKMVAGNHLRVHTDLYAGEFGYTYYLCKDWKWDWGGIVNYYIEQDETIIPIIPKFNRIVLRNEKIKLNHFVSTVEKYALCNRYTINGWGSTVDLSEQSKHKIIGEYSE